VAVEDTLSVTSLGSLRELPWSDVAKVEVANEAVNSNVDAEMKSGPDGPEKRRLAPGMVHHVADKSV